MSTAIEWTHPAYGLPPMYKTVLVATPDGPDLHSVTIAWVTPTGSWMSPFEHRLIEWPVVAWAELPEYTPQEEPER